MGYRLEHEFRNWNPNDVHMELQDAMDGENFEGDTHGEGFKGFVEINLASTDYWAISTPESVYFEEEEKLLEGDLLAMSRVWTRNDPYKNTDSSHWTFTYPTWIAKDIFPPNILSYYSSLNEEEDEEAYWREPQLWFGRYSQNGLHRRATQNRKNISRVEVKL